MRLFTAALGAAVAMGLVAGCSGSNLAPSAAAPGGAQANHLVNGHFIPGWSRYASLIPVELQRTPTTVLDRIMPGTHKKKGVIGVYGSTFYTSVIYGYKGGDPKNGPPLCTLTASYPNNIAVDGKGNLIDPDGGSRRVFAYKPDCGPMIGQIEDAYGQPSDAASFNAATSTVIVGNIYGTDSNGGITVCTFQTGGCTAWLTDYGTLYELVGVALAKNGDCWASGTNSAGTATMTYFRQCGAPGGGGRSGQGASGWKNTYYGGLDIDTQGNIVAVDAFVPQLWIYRGCNPACHVVGGPFPLHGDTVFGHLNRTGTQWVGGDYQNGMLDVYKYSTSALTYEYSISNGLDVSDEVEGAAFSPSSKQ